MKKKRRINYDISIPNQHIRFFDRGSADREKMEQKRKQNERNNIYKNRWKK